MMSKKLVSTWSVWTMFRVSSNLMSGSQFYNLSTNGRLGMKTTREPTTRPFALRVNWFSSKSQPQKPMKTVVFVSLHDSSGKHLGVKTKEEAQTLADKSNMMLVLRESKSFKDKYPAYYLVPPKEQLEDNDNLEEEEEEEEEEVTETGTGKTEMEVSKKPFRISQIKKVLVTSKITDHDVMIKSNQIKKWVEKNCEVRILVTGDGQNHKLDNVYAYFEKHLKGEARFLQKILKNNNLKFIVSPFPNKQQSGQINDGAEEVKPGGDKYTIDPNDLLKDGELDKMVEEKLKK